jgi:aryl-alcohol dehydrogenase-like predicted oxidoreductase
MAHPLCDFRDIVVFLLSEAGVFPGPINLRACWRLPLWRTSYLEQRKLGKTELAVSVLGFGAAEIGYEAAPQDVVDRIVRTALDSGVNVVDTGECYVDSEEKLGRALSGIRDRFHVFTKCGHASGLPYPDWSAELITASIDRSLHRLKTDRIDLIQLHSCSSDVLGRGDVITALQKARDAGKVRFVGYSGDADDALAAIETGAFDALQTSINLADQETVTLTIPKAQARGMGVIAKRALANAVWKHPERPSNSYVHEYWDRLKQIDYLFLHTCGLPESLATALRFTLSVPGVSMAIVGTKSAERWAETLSFAEPATLPKSQYEYIRQVWQDRASPEWRGQV